jgi:hypothetical protein
MLFSFPCPQCEHVMLADKDQVGRMTLCGNCLLSFPVPNNIASLPASAESKLTPRPTLEDDDDEIVLPQRGSEPGWGLVRLGLTLLQVSLIVFLAAGFIGYIAILFSGSRALANPFSPENPPVVIIAAFVSLTAMVTGFLGLCLCCAVPADVGFRFQIRAAVLLFLVAGAACAGALVLTSLTFRDLPAVDAILIAIAFFAFFGGVAGVGLWLLFLRNVAKYFRNRELAENAGALLLGGFFLSGFNICLVPCLREPSSLLMFAPLLVPCALYGWHLRLVIRIRHSIPVRNQRAP